MDTDTTPPSPTSAKRLLEESSGIPSLPKRLKLSDHQPSKDADPISAASGATSHLPVEPSEKAAELEKSPKKKRDAAGFPKSRKGKDKDNRNPGRKRRGTRNEESKGETSLEQVEPKESRLPKRQCALLLGFCGSQYSGMQIQPNVRTIENVVFDVLVKIGAVSKDNADDPVKVNIGRAARTDAGVHAAGNVVSLKMITTVPGVPNLVESVNAELPPDIRLWGYVRVQNKFNARLLCDSRKYTYFFPTYILLPPKFGCNLDRVLKGYAASLPPSSRPVPSKPDTSFWTIDDATKEDELRRKREWRVKPDILQKLRIIAKKYDGTHNFHNFTVGRVFSDRSNQRHMKKIEVADPVVYGNTEWISVVFHGQSFMLHQRKMMSGMILTARLEVPESMIDELFGPPIVFIPKMPSLGLLLEGPIYDSYNSKIAKVNETLQPTDAEYRPPIDFGIHAAAIEEFKQKHIYDNMRLVEDRNGLFDQWIRAVDSYAGNDLLYLNPRGIIPEIAKIKKDQRRENPFRERKLFNCTSFTTEGQLTEKSLDDGEESDTAIEKRTLLDTEG
ncbi:pseudouridine synthase [Pluteus cervinus]|uniref:Pseudouridine synthase n=1 Tax=Pluteus cervinus TaxID=181527 RepID=A0ACD3BAC3_9AGAR|nr:pseudouridine synthase [Pluteus cervinus]